MPMMKPGIEIDFRNVILRCFFFAVILFAANAYPLTKEYIISKMAKMEKIRTPAYEERLQPRHMFRGW